MLDAANPLPVPGAEVLAWTDLDSPSVVWALPVRPRLAVGADGLPDATLLLYRRAGAAPSGGQLNLAVDLRLTDAERAAAAAAGAARRPQPPPGAAQPPPVEVNTPQWAEGRVCAELLPGLTVTGRPSLAGDNTCLLTVHLDGAQAAAVQDAWDAGFPDATVELEGAVDAMTAGSASASTVATSTTSTTSTSASTTTSTSTSADVGRHTERRATEAVSATTRVAVRVPVQLRGPLRLPPSARTARRTDLTL